MHSTQRRRRRREVEKVSEKEDYLHALYTKEKEEEKKVSE